jgi:hypothetical protein
VGDPEALQVLAMLGPKTLTKSGALRSVKKRAIPAGLGTPRPKTTQASFRMPGLLRMLCWVERFSPPKVLLTFVPDSQPENPTIFREKI